MKLDKKNNTDSFFRTISHLNFLNHLNDFLLGIGVVFDIALSGGKGGMSGQHADIV